MFGATLAPAGDVDGDGFDDIVVGAPWWRDGDGPREGRVIVYRGAADGIAGPAWHADPTDLKGARFGSVLGPGWGRERGRVRRRGARRLRGDP